MRRPVTGEVHVHYHQIYVVSDPHGGAIPDLAEAFAGQHAGLCGAAAPGALWLSTGLHTGNVGFAVEVHDAEPALDPVWEDVVEVSFHPLSERTLLMQWAGEATWDLGLARTGYRVRYCARGMDEGRRLDSRVSGEPQADSYLLQFWPAPPRADRVVRQTSREAAHSHRSARGFPSPPTPEQRAETARLAHQAEERAAEERRHPGGVPRPPGSEGWRGRSPLDAVDGVGATSLCRVHFGRVRISAPSSVTAIVCSVCAVRQPVALRRVQPSASVTSRAVSAMTQGSRASSSPGRSV